MLSREGCIDLSGVDHASEDPVTERLLGALRQVRRAIDDTNNLAEVVYNAAQEIASGNVSLGQRTEEAASSLAKTAVAVSQVALATRTSADVASQAKAMVDEACEVAAQGGGAVQSVIDTMMSIQQSSRKITDIIGVIDGIAFQTNILALNAAVEAARAGEQGRGFAVVATEVRTLAQRSAEAAKEIKLLITRSVEQVDVGRGLVDQTGQIISDVVAQVRRANLMVGEITQSSVEQRKNCSQIDASMNVLDQTTQHNASLVEQTAAAAEGLQQQLARMLKSLSVFRTRAQPIMHEGQITMRIASLPR